MTRLVLLLALLPCPVVADGQPEDVDPLYGLLAITRRMEIGAATFMSGRTVKESFPWWVAGRRYDERELRTQLRQSDVKRLRAYGLRYALTLYHKDRVVYLLETYVEVTSGLPRLSRIAGTRVDDQSRGGHVITDATTQAEGAMLARAGLAMLARIRSGRAISRLSDRASHVSHAPELGRLVTVTERRVRDVIAEVKALGKIDAVRVTLGDATYIALAGRTERPLGVVRCDFALKQGRLTLRFGSLERWRDGRE